MLLINQLDRGSLLSLFKEVGFFFFMCHVYMIYGCIFDQWYRLGLSKSIYNILLLTSNSIVDNDLFYKLALKTKSKV